MEERIPWVEHETLRAAVGRDAKRARIPFGSVNGRPPLGAESEHCQARRLLAAARAMPYADGATGVWLLGSAAGQPETLGLEMPPPSLCVGATTSTGMMPLHPECGCARRREAWRANRPRRGEGRR